MRYIGAISGLISLALAGGAAAQVLVVRSSGPSSTAYPAGKSLPFSASVALKAGDAMTVLSEGSALSWRGPGLFSASARSAQAASNFAALSMQRTDRISRIGAARGLKIGGGAPKNPNLWFVDIEKSSPICFADPAAVALWRTDASRAATVKVIHVADGRSVDVAWTKGQTDLAWPSALPVRAGETYRLTWAGQAAPTEISFRAIPGPAQAVETTTQQLIQNGCAAQIDQLVAALSPAAAVGG